MTSALLAALLALASTPAPDVDDPLAPLRPLVGTWKGESKGVFGNAKQTKTFAFVLNGKFLQGRTKNTNPNDDHEDLGMYSYDRARKTLVLREFHTEGFVNTYRVDVKDDGKMLILTSESVENGGGMRARTTIRFKDKDSVHETFELASGDKPFKVCVEATLKRQ